MALFNWLSKSKQNEVFEALAKHYREVESGPEFRKQRELYDDFVANMCKDGVDVDELPTGVGEFGLTPTNPIPCKTVFGSIAYLAKLYAPDGRKVQYRRISSVKSPVSSNPVDMLRGNSPNRAKAGKPVYFPLPQA